MDYKFETLREIIAKYEEDHLLDALDRMHLDFEENSSFDALVDLLEEGIRKYIIEIYYMLSYEDLLHLSRMKENQGRFTLKEEDSEVGPPEELMEIIGLLDLCLVHPELDEEDGSLLTVHVSKEFIDLFESFLIPERLSMAGYLDEAAKIIKGALYYYGALEMDTLYDIVKRNHGNMDQKMFTRVLSYKHALADEYDSIYLGDKEYIVDLDFETFYDIGEVLTWNRGQGYKNYDRMDLLEAADPLFIEREEEYEKIYDYFFDKFIISEDVVEKYPHIPEDFYFDYFLEMTLDLARKSAQTDEIVEGFLEEMRFSTEEEKRKGRKLIIDHLNRISRWNNLGFAHDEMPKLKLGNKNVVHMKAYVSKKKD